MPYPIEIAKFDLSVFTGNPACLVLTAEESAHGYDYTLTYYISDDSDPLGRSEHWTFHDQESADVAAYYMAAKIKEILAR